MDLLADYGSESDSEQDVVPTTAAALATTSALTRNAAPQAPMLPAPDEDTGQALLKLPAPASSKPALFSGIPLPAKKRKKLVAQFRVPIDYGGLPEMSSLAEWEDAGAPRKRFQTGGDSKPLSLSELLPPPVSSGAGKRLAEPVLGGGTTARYHSDDDDDFVPGTEDRTGMHLGAATSAGAADTPAPIAVAGNEAYRVDASAAAVAGQYVQGEYQGQPYYYDPASGQYFYPDPSQQQQAQRPGVATAPSLDPVSAALEAAMAAEAARLGGPAGGIQFKEVSGAAIRHMDPSQRAELNALRSALGPDYEGRLRAEAAKVGDVSKRAKSRHQISSLYTYAKEQELEQLERRTTGMKTKAETQRKYGW